MKSRQIGKTEIQASSIGLGTWVMGGWMWGGTDDSLSERTVQTALDSGITLIGTAPIYGFGRSEEIIGRAIRGRRRESVVIASKCGLYWSYDLLPPNTGELHCYADDAGRTPVLEKYAVYRWLHPNVLRQGVEDSLRRLKTDYIDVMQVHHVSDRTTSVADVIGELEKMKEEGKIRAIGISNANQSQFEKYREYGGVDVSQERYSMLDRKIETNGLLDACRETGVSLFAYSPLENGLLTGKLTPERRFNDGDLRLGKPQFSNENIIKVNDALSVIEAISRKYNLTVGQFAVAWVFSRYEKAFVLCGARTPEQAVLNAFAGDTTITSEDMEEVDSILRKYSLLEVQNTKYSY